MAQDFNAWLNMLTNVNGDQTNPAVMSQMSQQASPFPLGQSQPPPPDNNPVPFYLRPPQQASPKVVPPPPMPASPYTAQPTTQPIGTVPQEIVPQQPSLAQPQSQSGPIDPQELLRRIEAIKPPDNSKMMAELALGEKNRQAQQLAQLGEIDKLKEGLAKYAREPEGFNFTPLAAFVDTLGGKDQRSHLMEAAKSMAPETHAEKARHMQDMQEKIATMQGQIPGQELDALKNKLAQMGYMDERQTKLEMAKMAAEARLGGMGSQATRAGTAQDRLAQSAQGKIHDDEIIKGAQKQINQMEIDKHTLNTAKVITPQMYDELTTGLANAISGGRASAVSTQERQHFDNAEKILAEIKQKVSSGVYDVNSPEVKQYLYDTIDRLGEGYRINAYARAKQKQAGAAKAYAHTPNALAALNDAVESYNPAKLAPRLMPKDQEAVDWAMQNRGNPDAEAILKMHGVK